MTHSPDPGGFLAGERGSAGGLWHWRLLTADGSEVTLPNTVSAEGPRFPSQGDAETWVGENWRDLADEGVSSVVLLEGDREVYGPMSLDPES